MSPREVLVPLPEKTEFMCILLRLVAIGLATGVPSGSLVSGQTCPSYTHKDSLLGQPSSLPDGFFVYGLANKTGLYKSPVRAFNPTIIPNTQNDSARSIEISDDGQWIIYRAPPTAATYLICPDGTKKTAVPISGAAAGLPKYVGFYRNSPYGTEIYSYVDKVRVDAIKVDFSSGTPVFSAQRTILQASTASKIYIDWDYQMAVARDQLVIRAGNSGERIHYYTIPNGGKGTAGDANFFLWKNDVPPQAYYGCSITMSHDGSMVAYNPGWQGNGACVPNKYSTPAPMDHKGFCITPFRRIGISPAMTWNESVDVYGTSINWAPNEFRFGQHFEVDFVQWYFANNSDYLIGVLRGNLSPVKGLWVVQWKTNRWTLVTPRTQEVLAFDPAIYLIPQTHVLDIHGPVSPQTAPADPDDPQYQVVQPAGGEKYHIGDKMDIKVRSIAYAPSVILLQFGRRNFIPDELNRPIDPQTDSMMSFTIPDSAGLSTGPDQITNYSLIGDSCKIVIRSYGGSNPYMASSPFFSIRAKNASVLPGAPMARSRASRLLQAADAVQVGAGVRGVEFYNSQGCRIWKWGRNGDTSLPVKVMIPQGLRNQAILYECY